MRFSEGAIEPMVGSEVFIFGVVVAKIHCDFVYITALKPTGIMRGLLLGKLTLQFIDLLLHLLDEQI